MRKVQLLIVTTLEVKDNISDEALYEAICNQFAGTNGQGLQAYPGSGPVIAEKHQMDIFRTEPVWQSDL